MIQLQLEKETFNTEGSLGKVKQKKTIPEDRIEIEKNLTAREQLNATVS